MKKTYAAIAAITFVTIAILTAACGSSSTGTSVTKPIASGSAGNNLTATLASVDGSFKKGPQEFTLTFTDASDKTVDVGSAALNFHMPAMGSMATMNDAATLTTTDKPGVYKGKVDLQMAGDWQAQITYEGQVGKGSVAIPIRAK
jgi:hypothetical protein